MDRTTQLRALLIRLVLDGAPRPVLEEVKERLVGAFITVVYSSLN